MQTLPKESASALHRSQTVLVLEDDESLLILLSNVLSMRGYFPVGCSFGDLAEAIHLEEQVACIVLDLGLMDRNDTSLLKSLGCHPEYKETPIIVHTGKALDSHTKAEVMCYADCLVTKSATSIDMVLRQIDHFSRYYQQVVHNSLNVEVVVRRPIVTG